MGSFQQVLMGLTCLVAAFFFGSYLHNRPAKNEQANGNQVAAVDPLESIFSFGKANQVEPATSENVVVPVDVAKLPVAQNIAQSAVVPSQSAIHHSERVPAFVDQSVNQQIPDPVRAQVKSQAIRKPVVPDFTDFASRFRSTPLQLDSATTSESPNRDVVHESERVPSANAMQAAPEIVIRKPEKLTPLRDFASQVDRIEQSIQGEFAKQEPQPQEEAGRWRVNRSKRLDQFRTNGQSPQPDNQPRETIEDIVARQSADYLLESDDSAKTFATDPIQDDWVATQRRQVTQQAAVRNRDILEIEDPGKRFHSVLNRATPVAPPEPDFETDYYAPAKPDLVEPRSNVGMNRIRKAQETNWQRRSNIRDGFEGSNEVGLNGSNTYQIQPGDTLQSISTRFYGVPDHYLELYKANRRVLDRITSSPAGVQIEIPELNN